MLTPARQLLAECVFISFSCDVLREIRHFTSRTNNKADTMKKIILSVISAVMLLPALSAHATDRSDDRQEARNTRQDSRTDGRQTKQDCFVDNNKSNSGCRQDKRENRRDGRRDAFDVKW